MSSITLEGLKEWMDALETAANRLTYLRDQIKEEFDLPRLKADLLALPEQIKKTQIIALQKKAELLEFEQQQMKQREAEILFEINNEKDGNGKAKFTNDPARKAELTIRLGKDEEYSDLKMARSAIESKVWESEAEAGRLRDEFKARQVIAGLVCAELNLYTK